MSDLAESIRGVVVLKPGDRVLLVMREPWSEADLAEVKGQLREFFPEAKFACVDGIDSVIVAHADA